MIDALLARWRFARFCIVHRRSERAQRRWQLRHLRQLLRYAYANVPLWRELLDARGISPDAIRSLDDLPLLPVTRKETFIGRMVEEYIDNSKPVRSYWYVTSGTSGTPFRFLMKERAIMDKYVDFASFRFLWWRGISLEQVSNMNLTRIKIRGPSSEHRQFIPVESYLKDPQQALAAMARFQTDILSAYPSLLTDMARHIRANPALPRPKPRFILSFGEMLAPDVRRFIEESFGGEVYDRYGLEEIGVVGVECAEHAGFHINTESVIVEITDEEFRPVRDGQEGRIVVSDLFNFGMPFIRYDSGDRGVVSHEPCRCGLRSPRLWIKGRYTAFLAFTGRRIHHLEFDGAMDGFMNHIFQYQIAKKSNDRVVARIIAGPAYHEDVPRLIRARLCALVGDTVTIDVELVEKLPPAPSGKSRIVIDESEQ